MSDELKNGRGKTPSLTLDPFAGAESKPELTLEVPQAKAVEQVVEENPLDPRGTATGMNSQGNYQ